MPLSNKDIFTISSPNLFFKILQTTKLIHIILQFNAETVPNKKPSLLWKVPADGIADEGFEYIMERLETLSKNGSLGVSEGKK